MFKWRRQDSAWHLWREAETTDGAAIWQETGYIITGWSRGNYYLKGPGMRNVSMQRYLRDAKSMAENLAQNSR